MMRIFLFCFVFLMGLTAFGQDYRFTQYFNAPQTLNPSLIGLFQGTSRVSGIYRNQWSSLLDSPFTTYSVGYDKKFNVYGDDVFAVGLNTVLDQVGNNDGKFRHTEIMFGGSYLKLLSENRYNQSAHYLAIGVQGGWGFNQFFTDDAWFSSQFDLNTFEVNEGTSSGEGFRNTNRNYFDSHVGLTYYGKLNDKTSLVLGGAYHHINKPIIFFSGNRDFINPKITGHLSFDYKFTDEFSIQPIVVFQSQGPSSNALFGSSIKYSNGDWNEVAMRIGAFSYMANSINSFIQDAVSVFVQAEIEQLIVGMSYDVNLSSLSIFTDKRGAFEMSVSYRFFGNVRQQIKSPEFF